MVLFTSTPGFEGDVKLSGLMKQANPRLKICFVGPHVTISPDHALSHPEIDFIVRREFDYAVVEYANGKPLAEIARRELPSARMARWCTTSTVR